MRRYPIVCPSCRGRGLIDNPEPVSSASTITCPACKGTKIVMVDEDDWGRKENIWVCPECKQEIDYILGDDKKCWNCGYTEKA